MPSTRGRVLPVLLAAAVLVGGANLAAYAANGDLLVLGQKNSATKTTTIKNSKGTALSLKSKAGKAPLKVSNSTTVTKLSADLLDGQDSAALRNRTYVYTLAGSSTAADTAWALPGLPAGRYLASYSVVAAFDAPTATFACFFAPATGSVSRFTAITESGASASQHFLSGSGYVDTTTGPYVLGCEKGAGVTMVMSPPPLGPAQVVLTRVDDVTTGAAAAPVPLVGTPRPGGHALQR